MNAPTSGIRNIFYNSVHIIYFTGIYMPRGGGGRLRGYINCVLVIGFAQIVTSRINYHHPPPGEISAGDEGEEVMIDYCSGATRRAYAVIRLSSLRHDSYRRIDPYRIIIGRSFLSVNLFFFNIITTCITPTNSMKLKIV